MTPPNDIATARGLRDRIRRVRQEPRRRDLQVLRVDAPSPHVHRITFGGDDLADFASHAFDDHVKVFVPAPDGGPQVARDYTPRRFDALRRELLVPPTGIEPVSSA
jgi:NADPH-dependent ferric siderophore reductase